MTKTKQIIITGNIGSGKSTATEFFRENGYEVISADVVSSIILEKNHEKVSKMFGIRPMKFGEFKKELGKMVFSNKEVKKTLEDFMLPLIGNQIHFESTLATVTNKKSIIEMPTYFEVRGLAKNENNIVILVTAPDEIRFSRILKRNPHLTEEDVSNRIASQIPQEEKVKYSDIVLENIDINIFKEQLNKVIKDLDNEPFGKATEY